MIIHNNNIYTLRHGTNKCPEKLGSKKQVGLEKLKIDNYKLYIFK